MFQKLMFELIASLVSGNVIALLPRDILSPNKNASILGSYLECNDKSIIIEQYSCMKLELSAF